MRWEGLESRVAVRFLKKVVYAALRFREWVSKSTFSNYSFGREMQHDCGILLQGSADTAVSATEGDDAA